MMVIASRESADSLESVIQSLLSICSNAAESSFVQFLERVFSIPGYRPAAGCQDDWNTSPNAWLLLRNTYMLIEF